MAVQLPLTSLQPRSGESKLYLLTHTNVSYSMLRIDAGGIEEADLMFTYSLPPSEYVNILAATEWKRKHGVTNVPLAGLQGSELASSTPWLQGSEYVNIAALQPRRGEAPTEVPLRESKLRKRQEAKGSKRKQVYRIERDLVSILS